MDKKILLTTICTAIINLTMFAGATFLDDSVSWLYKNGYTIFGKVSDYKPKNYLRRDEAAKFFVKVAEWLGKTLYVQSADKCIFSDISNKNGRTDLNNFILKSCMMWILQGTGWKFMPDWALTNSQALVSLLRITSWYEDETGSDYWAAGYYKKAKSLGRLSVLPELESKESIFTRGTAAKMLYNYQKNIAGNNSNSTPNSSGTSSLKADCWSRTKPAGSNEETEKCMDKKFKTCSPATMINFSLDPEQNPFESWDKTYYKSIFEIIWYENDTCTVKLTYITSQVSNWNNKSMLCNFDKSKSFIENIGGYYIKKCSWPLYDAMINN